MQLPSPIEFENEMAKHSFNVFSHLAFNLNIVGWRNKKGRVNKFDDLISVYWKDSKDRWEFRGWEASTRPGLHYLLKPLNVKGTAILAQGQYEGAYKIGLHKGEDALRQVGPVKVYRDTNMDSKIDFNKNNIETGLFGIHIHRAGIITKLVGNWSAGCQVFKKLVDFEEFIGLCEVSSLYFGNKFTYTLIEI